MLSRRIALVLVLFGLVASASLAMADDSGGTGGTLPPKPKPVAPMVAP